MITKDSIDEIQDNLEFMIRDFGNINAILMAPNILGNHYGDIQTKN